MSQKVGTFISGRKFDIHPACHAWRQEGYEDVCAADLMLARRPGHSI